jgi:7-cyano-7-deazaguanine synthase in queuosine biosynthesis
MTSYYFKVQDSQTGSGTQLTLGKHVIAGEKEFRSYFSECDSLESDLLNLAAAIFAADRGTPRGLREDYAREIEIQVPIVNIGVIQMQVAALEQLLRTLSNDLWTIKLYQSKGDLQSDKSPSTQDGQVLLFSGGLDSLAAAYQFGKDKKLTLVSHVTMSRQVREAQDQLISALEVRGIALEHHRFFVSSRNAPGFKHDLEGSQRTRSFMFLTLAALVSRKKGLRRILMLAENGQMAIHLPLSSARMAAFSTHTAHPEVLNLASQFFSSVFGFNLLIENPFVAMTKAEVVRQLATEAPELIVPSNSCWKSSRMSANATHCGECIPCFIRRISIERHIVDVTAYERDCFAQNFGTLLPEDEGRRNLADLAEFSNKFSTMSDSELFDEWPELYSTQIDVSAVISMYRRAANETREFLARFPGMQVLLT